METPQRASPGLLALGIVTIIVGVLYVGLVSCSAGYYALLPQMASIPGVAAGLEPTMRLMEDPLVLASIIVGIVVPGVLNTLVILAGVGMLKLKAWGRRLGLFYALASLGYWLANLPFALFVMQPRTAELLENAPGTGLGAQLVGIAIGAIFNNALPIALLIVLTRPRIKSQFPA